MLAEITLTTSQLIAILTTLGGVVSSVIALLYRQLMKSKDERIKQLIEEKTELKVQNQVLSNRLMER
jgi:regulator of replication initiation timing